MFGADQVCYLFEQTAKLLCCACTTFASITHTVAQKPGQSNARGLRSCGFKTVSGCFEAFSHILLVQRVIGALHSGWRAFRMNCDCRSFIQLTVCYNFGCHNYHLAGSQVLMHCHKVRLLPRECGALQGVVPYW
eukprot:6213303-Pleurochrysis_carterae.AAC.4